MDKKTLERIELALKLNAPKWAASTTEMNAAGGLPEFVAIAQTFHKPEIADVLVFNARVIGSQDPSYHVANLEQARQEFGF
jgi:hypothetical protein